ncbi:MAG: EF-hand domain-containing protein [Sphingomonas sp.]
MRPFPLLGPLLGLLLATPAFAQQAAPPPVAAANRPAQPPATIIAEPVAMMIAAFDADGDARVTRAEFDAGLRRSYDSVDTGHTGSIGYIAFSDWALRWLGDSNALPSPFEVDHDGDNRIAFDELAARFDLFFARFDADKDGAIARSELVTLRGGAMIFSRDRQRPQGGQQPRRNFRPMS